jgi:hypothetical protein
MYRMPEIMLGAAVLICGVAIAEYISAEAAHVRTKTASKAIKQSMQLKKMLDQESEEINDTGAA